MPALHPDVLALLQKAREAGSQPFETQTPEAARAAHAARARALQSEGPALPWVRDMTARAGEGPPVPVRLYRAAETEPGGAPLPCLLYLHGGGWVLGSLETHDGLCRRLARRLGACVLAVEYRLAAEAPALGIDPARIAVGGDSAGANLAAVLALMARDGDVPSVVFQMLLYPAVDLAMTGESYERFRDGLPLTAATMRWFIDHYLPPPMDRADWRVSPARAPSLAGTAPALVLTCGHDPLCSEGQLYAARLEREGVRVTHLHLSDQMHGILTMDKAIGPVAEVVDLAAGVLRRAW
ncbi:alpha/beta hydrolase [Pseudoroseomonas rhizosphaerae]|uniref:Alpha/beta hydrolase n=1 Tax=Teichococcus rhizosphaerae TaxID=1335062 RepID=A0A2C7AF36_9PROT|nr:alpha/beta hydrolase [Pseudoroseomonas rhizosphaerae]PHK96055.1 alpha/beta hydrolase [Pseudoroseomonas rhizosphaerae]